MIRIIKITGNKFAGYGLGLAVWLMPLVICNRMMWDFYYPKELFFQITISAVLVIQLFRKETNIHFNWLDVIVITGTVAAAALAGGDLSGNRPKRRSSEKAPGD